MEPHVTRVRSVEPGQIDAAAKKYIAAEALKKFGDVKVVKAQ